MWKAFRVVARRRVAGRKDPTRDEVYAAGGAESPSVGCEFACYAMIADKDLFENIRSVEEATILINAGSVVEVVPGKNGSVTGVYPVLSFDQIICPHLLKIRPDCKDNRKPKKAKRIKADPEVAEDKADPTDFTPAARPNSEAHQSFISFLLAALLSSVPIFTVVYLMTFGCGGYYPCGGNFGFVVDPKWLVGQRVRSRGERREQRSCRRRARHRRKITRKDDDVFAEAAIWNEEQKARLGALSSTAG